MLLKVIQDLIKHKVLPKLITQYCPSLEWLPYHSKWLGDNRDTAVHLHQMGSTRLNQQGVLRIQEKEIKNFFTWKIVSH